WRGRHRAAARGRAADLRVRGGARPGHRRRPSDLARRHRHRPGQLLRLRAGAAAVGRRYRRTARGRRLRRQLTRTGLPGQCRNGAGPSRGTVTETWLATVPEGTDPAEVAATASSDEITVRTVEEAEEDAAGDFL